MWGQCEGPLFEFFFTYTHSCRQIRQCLPFSMYSDYVPEGAFKASCSSRECTEAMPSPPSAQGCTQTLPPPPLYYRDEFLEGARDAIQATLGLVGSGDFEKLRGLVSAKVSGAEAEVGPRRTLLPTLEEVGPRWRWGLSQPPSFQQQSPLALGLPPMWQEFPGEFVWSGEWREGAQRRVSAGTAAS